jgi:dsDNA-binding SOS-regulon protein
MDETQAENLGLYLAEQEETAGCIEATYTHLPSSVKPSILNNRTLS